MSYLGNVAGPVKSVAGKVGEVELNNADVGLNNVTNDAQLKIASNLSDLNDAATARTNLGLGTAAVANILGTVSQSGGIPTGAIIERGSNANGEYVRFADGTQICRSLVRLTWTASTNSAVATWTYPSSFISTPLVTGSSLGGNAIYMATLTYNNGNSTSDVLGRFQTTQSVSRDVSAIAIGRWY